MKFTDDDIREWDALRRLLKAAIERSVQNKALIARTIGVDTQGFSNQIGGTRPKVMVLPTYSRALTECGIDIKSMIAAAINHVDELPEAVAETIESPEFQRFANTEEKAALIALAKTGFFDKAKPVDVKAVWLQMVDARKS
ncbi:hypothetical protein JXA32_16095 [Candidatus Sumerlaeota bacterium]|nr:hypothetical protein [Candidatus Sumerlaeota bacterium]